jgi:Tol biopolymer transport system component
VKHTLTETKIFKLFIIVTLALISIGTVVAFSFYIYFQSIQAYFSVQANWPQIDQIIPSQALDQENGISIGQRVIFIDVDRNTQKYSLMITDQEGNRMQRLWRVTGTPAWSPKGNLIAVGCGDNPAEICIIDPRAIIDLKPYPREIFIMDPITQRIKLPEECATALNYKDAPPFGIISISWSRDSKKLAVVCGEPHKTSVCVVSLEGESYCWDNPDLLNGAVIRAIWSPVDDDLVVSGTAPDNAIYIVDPFGKNELFLDTGENPEWSPDGKNIAYMTWDEERQYYSLAVIDADGTNQAWLYRPPKRGSGTNEEYYKITLCGGGSGIGCRLSWSSDGKYLVFDAHVGDGYDSQIFRLDVTTGEIIYLTNELSTGYREPDWEPLP